MAGQVERVGQQNHPRRLFWGTRALETALVVVGIGLAVTAAKTDPYRITTGGTIAFVGIKGIIESLRGLRSSRNDINQRAL